MKYTLFTLISCIFLVILFIFPFILFYPVDLSLFYLVLHSCQLCDWGGYRDIKSQHCRTFLCLSMLTEPGNVINWRFLIIPRVSTSLYLVCNLLSPVPINPVIFLPDQFFLTKRGSFLFAFLFFLKLSSSSASDPLEEARNESSRIVDFCDCSLTGDQVTASFFLYCSRLGGFNSLLGVYYAEYFVKEFGYSDNYWHDCNILNPLFLLFFFQNPYIFSNFSLLVLLCYQLEQRHKLPGRTTFLVFEDNT